jgi:hypothetical protein
VSPIDVSKVASAQTANNLKAVVVAVVTLIAGTGALSEQTAGLIGEKAGIFCGLIATLGSLVLAIMPQIKLLGGKKAK